MSNVDGKGPVTPPPEYFTGEYPVVYLQTCLACDIQVVTDPWFYDWVFYTLEHIADNKHRPVPWNLITE